MKLARLHTYVAGCLLLGMPFVVSGGTLYFQSNFDTGVNILSPRVFPESGNKLDSSGRVIGVWAVDLTGKDYLAAPSDWQSGLERRKGRASVNGASIGHAFINVDDESKSTAALSADPANPTSGNRVLRYQLTQYTQFYGRPESNRARAQLEMVENQNWKEFHFSTKVYLPSATMDRVKALAATWGTIEGWFNLFEINHPGTTTTAASRESRVQLDIWPFRSGGQDVLRWVLRSQDQNSSGNWRAPMWSYRSTAAVPTNRWITLDFYIKEGGNENSSNPGRAYVAMTDGGTRTVLFNIKGPTMSLIPNNKLAGYTAFSALKLYTNQRVIDAVNPPATRNNPVRLYYDDYRLYYGSYSGASGNGTYTSDSTNSTGIAPVRTWVP